MFILIFTMKAILLLVPSLNKFNLLTDIFVFYLFFICNIIVL